MSDHDELRDSAAAWVLGALDEEDAYGFAAHLEVCASCRTEVADLSGAADALALCVPQVDPPPSLKRRLMAVVEEEASGRRAAARERAPRRDWLAPLRARPLGVALGVALVALACVAGGFALRGAAAPDRTLAVHVDDRLAPGARAQLVHAGDTLEVRVEHMPAPPRGKVYEVWVRRGGAAPRPDALFTVDRRGRGGAAVLADPRSVDVVMVTTEPARGSDAPTSAPLIVARPV